MKKVSAAYMVFVTVFLFTACGESGSGDSGTASVPSKVYAVGDTGPGGGIVFYTTDGGLHGLEAAQSDQSTGIRWNNGYYTITAASAIVVGSGSSNTETILSAQGDIETSYAAGAAQTCSDGEYDDWFLPSKNELNLMYVNLKCAVPSAGGFGGNYYWSSSEYDSGLAWYQNFGSGLMDGESKVSLLSIRAVRGF